MTVPELTDITITLPQGTKQAQYYGEKSHRSSQVLQSMPPLWTSSPLFFDRFRTFQKSSFSVMMILQLGACCQHSLPGKKNAHNHVPDFPGKISRWTPASKLLCYHVVRLITFSTQRRRDTKRKTAQSVFICAHLW
jgi:hypothetical protein